MQQLILSSSVSKQFMPQEDAYYPHHGTAAGTTTGIETATLTSPLSSTLIFPLSSYFLSSFLPSSHDGTAMNTTTTSQQQLIHKYLYKRNFFYRGWKNQQHEQLPPPIEVMIEYIQQHSNQQLEKEWNDCQQQQQQQQQQHTPSCPQLQHDRKYIVATYSCPIESGNRLHRYMNGLLWSVLTNRTFLWRYQSKQVCQEYEEDDCDSEYNSAIIRGTHEQDCYGLLSRNTWIPSYDLWKNRLFNNNRNTTASATTTTTTTTTHNTPNNRTDTRIDFIILPRGEISGGKSERVKDPITLPYDSEENENTLLVFRTGKQVNLNPGSILLKGDKDKDKDDDDINKNNNQTATTKDTYNNTNATPTTKPIITNRHLIQPQNLQRLSKLRSHGVYFVYGMFFEALFTLDPSLDPAPELLAINSNSNSKAMSTSTSTSTSTSSRRRRRTRSDNDDDRNNNYIETYFLHSRHTGQFSDTYIWMEHLCLEKMVPKINDTYNDSYSDNSYGNINSTITVSGNTTNGTTSTRATTNDNDNVTTIIIIPPPCHIYVISDRPTTVQLLHTEIRNTSRCTSSSIDQHVRHHPVKPPPLPPPRIVSTSSPTPIPTITTQNATHHHYQNNNHRHRHLKRKDRKKGFSTISFRSEHGPRGKHSIL